MRLGPKELWAITKQTVEEWLDARAMSLAASLALYTLLSLAPLVVICVAVAGMFFGREAAGNELTRQLEALMGHDGAEVAKTLLASAKSPSSGVVATLLGVVILLLGASGVFTELQETMNIVWNVKAKPGGGIKTFLRDRVFSFAMVMTIAFLLLASLVLSTVLSAAGRFVSDRLPGGETFWQVLNFVLSFGIVTLLFAMIFKVVPDAKVRWRDTWVGALFTALLFTIGKLGLGIYLGKAAPGSSYGAAGSFVAVIAWVYWSAQILFFGAEFTQVWAKRFGGGIEPTKNAVRIHDAADPPGVGARSQSA
jgi:membrane protein